MVCTTAHIVGLALALRRVGRSNQLSCTAAQRERWPYDAQAKALSYLILLLLNLPEGRTQRDLVSAATEHA